MAQQRRRWSPEFKRDAVNLVRSSGRPAAEVARELGVGESSLAYWLAKDRKARRVADPERFAVETTESDEVRYLRKRVVELETVSRPVSHHHRHRPGVGDSLTSRESRLAGGPSGHGARLRPLRAEHRPRP
jgi:transposase